RARAEAAAPVSHPAPTADDTLARATRFNSFRQAVRGAMTEQLPPVPESDAMTGQLLPPLPESGALTGQLPPPVPESEPERSEPAESLTHPLPEGNPTS
ncbi:ATP-binding protein, partial [Streptomyces sp. W16]|nr:ATP-binding protein [Streptomyces sp. W16]